MYSCNCSGKLLKLFLQWCPGRNHSHAGHTGPHADFTQPACLHAYRITCMVPAALLMHQLCFLTCITSCFQQSSALCDTNTSIQLEKVAAKQCMWINPQLLQTLSERVRAAKVESSEMPALKMEHSPLFAFCVFFICACWLVCLDSPGVLDFFLGSCQCIALVRLACGGSEAELMLPNPG